MMSKFFWVHDRLDSRLVWSFRTLAQTQSHGGWNYTPLLPGSAVNQAAAVTAALQRTSPQNPPSLSRRPWRVSRRASDAKQQPQTGGQRGSVETRPKEKRRGAAPPIHADRRLWPAALSYWTSRALGLRR